MFCEIDPCFLISMMRIPFLLCSVRRNYAYVLRGRPLCLWFAKRIPTRHGCAPFWLLPLPSRELILLLEVLSSSFNLEGDDSLPWGLCLISTLEGADYLPRDDHIFAFWEVVSLLKALASLILRSWFPLHSTFVLEELIPPSRSLCHSRNWFPCPTTFVLEEAIPSSRYCRPQGS